MDLVQVSQRPIKVTFNGLAIFVPKFKGSDWVDWCIEKDEIRLNKATEKFDEQTRFRMLNFYNFMPSTIEEARDWVNTPDGVYRICQVCLKRATTDNKPLPEQTIKEILDTVDFAGLSQLAKQLADTQDNSKLNVNEQKTLDQPKETFDDVEEQIKQVTDPLGSKPSDVSKS